MSRKRSDNYGGLWRDVMDRNNMLRTRTAYRSASPAPPRAPGGLRLLREAMKRPRGFDGPPDWSSNTCRLHAPQNLPPGSTVKPFRENTNMLCVWCESNITLYRVCVNIILSHEWSLIIIETNKTNIIME